MKKGLFLIALCLAFCIYGGNKQCCCVYQAMRDHEKTNEVVQYSSTSINDGVWPPTNDTGFLYEYFFGCFGCNNQCSCACDAPQRDCCVMSSLCGCISVLGGIACLLF